MISLSLITLGFNGLKINVKSRPPFKDKGKIA